MDTAHMHRNGHGPPLVVGLGALKATRGNSEPVLHKPLTPGKELTEQCLHAVTIRQQQEPISIKLNWVGHSQWVFFVLSQG